MGGLRDLMAMLKKEVHPQEVAGLTESDLDQEIAGYVYIFNLQSGRECYKYSIPVSPLYITYIKVFMLVIIGRNKIFVTEVLLQII